MRLPTWLRSTNTSRLATPAWSRLGVERLEARDNPSGGLLDTTFGTNGMADLGAMPAIDNVAVAGVATQADGKVLTVGTVYRSNGYLQAAVTRLNANGAPDPTFGTGGTVTLPVAKDSWGKAIAVQPDGKILVTGTAYTKSSFFSGSTDSEYAVARLNTNGTLDNTFGGAGTDWWVSNPTKGEEAVTRLAVVSSGTAWSIYAGGYAGSAMVVVKLTAAGRPDTTYGAGGVASRTLPTGVGDTMPLAVTPSGRAVVANGSLYAFTPAGQVDTEFGTNGVTTNTLGGGIVLAIAAQGENIVAAGYKPTAISPTGMNVGVMSRYSPAGVTDPTFGPAGAFYGPSVGGATPTASYFGGVAVASDGSIVAVGTIAQKDAASVVTRGVLLARLTVSGQPDVTFGPTPDGSGTVARFNVNPNLSILFGSRLALAVDADGNIILGNRLGTFSNGGVRGVVLRFTGN